EAGAARQLKISYSFCMVGTLARLGVLASALVLAAASTSSQGHSHSPQYPSSPPPSQQQPPPPGQSHVQPPPPMAASPQPSPESVYVCTELHPPRTNGSLCFPSQERCDRKRVDAEKDGARTSDCRPVSPVSCFQLGGDPSPASEACAATPMDCDLLRL